ncbi:hypothetical protein BCON_0023g00310 [Botryotinia convoluta]|uniref:Cytochrome P450 n=1 Tax=Botryotinia convoluta TaxID=54673 RepID=A0A4Z1IYR1_9HELO|nr:hypothetical protein BCON_0023g00310 [Botryotinia convoluta]
MTVKNLLGKYTGTLVMLESNLHVRVLQNKLTPNLSDYLTRAKAELEFGWKMDVPRAQDWVEVDIQAIVRALVSRMSAVVFLGHPACRNEDWLRLRVNFSINIFHTSLAMRMFPPLLHPFIAPILPSRHLARQNLALARRIIAPIIEKHKKLPAGRRPDKTQTEEDSLLTWMVDNATDVENQSDQMASRQLILTLASIHTTSMAVSHALFDLCAHPEFFEPLREEIERVLAGSQTLEVKHMQDLQMLDSFLVESQRFNPPILLSPQRLVMEPLTLRDGTYLPKGTHISFPSADILMDNSVTPNASLFDPLRSYRNRQQTGQSNRHLLGQTDKDHLAIGHGKQACPGRMFAVSEIKLILARFLLDYDFKYPQGCTRPKNMFLDENVFIDPLAKLMMQRRFALQA